MEPFLPATMLWIGKQQLCFCTHSQHCIWGKGQISKILIYYKQDSLKIIEKKWKRIVCPLSLIKFLIIHWKSLPFSTLPLIWQPLKQFSHTKLLQIQHFFTKVRILMLIEEVYGIQYYRFTVQRYIKYLFFASRLETNSSKMAKTRSQSKKSRQREILMLICVSSQHQNQSTSVAHQSMSVFVQRGTKIRFKHQNPVP